MGGPRANKIQDLLPHGAGQAPLPLWLLARSEYLEMAAETRVGLGATAFIHYESTTLIPSPLGRGDEKN